MTSEPVFPMLKVLRLEDDDDDAELIAETLRKSGIKCGITRVQVRSEFLVALDNSNWDLILADSSLPSFSGISALKIAVAQAPATPFIFVTGTMGEDRGLSISSLVRPTTC